VIPIRLPGRPVPSLGSRQATISTSVPWGGTSGRRDPSANAPRARATARAPSPKFGVRAPVRRDRPALPL
jgi:hypothetical protein